MEKLKILLNKYKKAITRLERVMTIEESNEEFLEIKRDSTIKRFEFCFDLFWLREASPFQMEQPNTGKPMLTEKIEKRLRRSLPSGRRSLPSGKELVREIAREIGSISEDAVRKYIEKQRKG